MMDWDTLTPLTALTHLDGRNSRKLVALRPIFSEFAWMKLRLGVMISYVLAVAHAITGKKISAIALGLQLLRSRGEVMAPALAKVIRALGSLATSEKDTAMVARTHGQPANVTTFGKELAVPLSGLCDELEMFQSIRLTAKCSGEVGSFQAFIGMDPKLDWIRFTDTFVSSFGLVPAHAATQIAPYDSSIRYLQSLWRKSGFQR